jgi:O-antigen ligase
MKPQKIMTFAGFGLVASLAPLWFPLVWNATYLIYSDGIIYLLFLSLMAILFALRFSRSDRHLVPRFVVPLFFVLILGAVAGQLNQYHLDSVVTEKTVRSRFLLVVFLPTLLVTVILFRRIRLRDMLGSMGLIGMVAALSLIMQWILLDQLSVGSRPVGPVDTSGSYDGLVRLDGHYSAPVIAATVMLACWPLAFSFVRCIGGSLGRPLQFSLSAGFMAVQIAAILLTWTRAAYLGLVLQGLAVGVYALVTAPRGTIKRVPMGLGTMAAVAACTGVIVVAFHPDMIRRGLSLANFSEASISNRMEVYQAGIKLVFERPIAGWGVGMFEDMFATHFRIPGVNYDYADAHSTILLAIFEYGLAGVLIVMLGLLGPCPMRTLLRIPAAAWVSAVGILPCLLSDNPIYRDVTLIMMLALGTAFVLRLGVLRALPQPNGGRLGTHTTRGRKWLTPGTFAILAIAALLPPQGHLDRYFQAMTVASQKLQGVVGFVLLDHPTGRLETFGRTDVQPSILAGIGVVAASSLSSSTTQTPILLRLPGTAIAVPVNLSGANAARLLLQNPSRENLAACMEFLSDPALSAASLEYLGHRGIGRAQLLEICETCSTLEVPGLRTRFQDGLEPLATTATLPTVISLYRKIAAMDHQVMNNGRPSRPMEEGTDGLGMARHLQSVQSLQGVSVFTGPLREEVVIVSEGFPGWTLGGWYQAKKPVTPRVDNASNRVFAEAAWRTFCLLERYPLIMRGNQFSLP